MAGKLWKDVRVYFGTYDFSTASVNVGVTLESLPLDPTIFTDAAQRAIAGNRQDSIEWAGLFDDGTSVDAAGSAMIGSGTNNPISICIGTTVGDRAYGGTGYLLAAKSVSRLGELVRQEVVIRPDQAWDIGTVQFAKGNLAAGGNGGALDGTAATTAGGILYIHIFSGTGGTGTISLALADNPTGTGAGGLTWVSGGTLLLTGTSGTSAKLTLTGTIKRYTYLRNDDFIGSGTATVTCMLVRS